MDDEIRVFGESLGKRALARDWKGVRELLAPWLQASLTDDSVRAFFEDEYLSTLRANGVEELQYPQFPEPTLGGNTHMNATALREPISWAGNKIRPIPHEVTDDNICYWMKLQLHCSDDQSAELDFDTFAEIWMAVVRTDVGLRAGYWSHGAY
jgi:hypothetical protein